MIYFGFFIRAILLKEKVNTCFPVIGQPENTSPFMGTSRGIFHQGIHIFYTVETES